MNGTTSENSPREETQFRLVMLGAVLVLMSYVWPLLVSWRCYSKLNNLEHRVERIQNGVSMVTIKDINTGKDMRYVAVGAAKMSELSNKKSPALMVYVSEDEYEGWVDSLRMQIVRHLENEERAKESAGL